MRILLIGKTGQLGSDILRIGHEMHEIHAPEKNVLDIGSPGKIEETVDSYRPHVVINTAAYHNVPLCEIEWGMAFKINCIAVRDLARACKRVRGLFITFSTDYVFDGRKRTPYLEDDKPAPLQIYGISKLAGEWAAMSVLPERSIIIRTCGLYGLSGAKTKGGNFVDNRINDARNNDIVEMSSDQVVSPTFAEDLARAVLQLVVHPDIRPGIYHLVNEGEGSWYEFTKAIFEIMGLQAEVRPVDRKGLSGGMRRPLYSVLANTKAKALGISLPCWRDAIERYLRVKYKSD
jgi:dTDP-4-dehydrorhamnose reductase